MQVTILKLEDIHNFEEYSKYLGYVSSERRSKVERIKPIEDKVTSLCAELLARSQISQELHIPTANVEFEYNSYGKPLLKDNPSYDFSISHSDGYVVFASDVAPVGVDIETLKPPNFRLAKRFFTPTEYDYIMKSENPSLKFFEVWTKKEAYIKMLGTGFSTPLSTFDILSPENITKFFNTFTDSYQLSVCFEKKIIRKIEIVDVNLNEVLNNF